MKMIPSTLVLGTFITATTVHAFNSPPPTPSPPPVCFDMAVVNDFICNQDDRLVGTITGPRDSCSDVNPFRSCDADGRTFQSLWPTCSGSGGTLNVVSRDFPFFVSCRSFLDDFTAGATTTLCDRLEGCSRRRRMTAANQYQEHIDEQEQLQESCGDFEYEGAIFVTDHIYLMATPGMEAEKAGCPRAVAHAVFEQDTAMADKEIIIWPSGHVGAKEEMFPADQALVMGTFKMSDLLKALRAAEPSRTEVAGYDIVSNNCSVFALNIAKELGIDVLSNRKVISFVSRRLAKHATDEIFTRLRQSLGLSDADRQLRGVTNDDSTLVELLVDQSVAVGAAI